MTEPTMTKWQSWNDMNPLRLHRRKTRLSIVTAAQMIGVSVNTIAKWEAGISQPSEHNLDRIEQFMRRPAKQAWRAWNTSKPRTAAQA